MVLADRARRGESGFSLLESMIAVVVLGIIVSAMVGGMATSITMSGIHRQQASSNAVMVSAAEVVKHLPYENCASLANPAYSTANVPLPSGWPTDSIRVAVQYWNQNAGVFDSTCRDGADPFPMQLVTILVTAPGSVVNACPLYTGPVQPPSTSCIAVVKRGS